MRPGKPNRTVTPVRIYSHWSAWIPLWSPPLLPSSQVPSGLTFSALAIGEGHGHCMPPHVEGQWSALFGQPYDEVPRSKGIRLTNGIMHDNQTPSALAAQMEISAAISVDKANHLWGGPLGHKMVDWCHANAPPAPLASDRLMLWLRAAGRHGCSSESSCGFHGCTSNPAECSLKRRQGRA